MPTTERQAKPIICSGDEVRGLLDGSRTQTRRVMKPQPRLGLYGNGKVIRDDYFVWERPGKSTIPMTKGCAYLLERAAPYQIGDLLWVRETFKEVGAFLGWDKVDGKCPNGCGVIAYRADGELRQYSIVLKEPERIALGDIPDAEKVSWRPSIHMPRWACRIMLELTDVRVERVQDISDYDACCEGALRVDTDSVRPGYMAEAKAANEAGIKPPLGPGPRERFRWFWDSLYAKRGYSWDSNVWVWVLTFKVVGE